MSGAAIVLVLVLVLAIGNQAGCPRSVSGAFIVLVLLGAALLSGRRRR